MGYYGKRWRICGVVAGSITRSYGANGQYSVLFERENASLEQIESIDWEKPVIEYIGTHGSEPGLPEGYGFDVVRIEYTSATKCYTVTLKTAAQYLGDVTGYQARIDEQKAVIDKKTQEIAELTVQLAEADELAISLYEEQAGNDEEGEEA